MHTHRDIHMNVVKRILRYLKGTVGDKLVYCRSKDQATAHELIIYVYADLAEDLDERTISGFCILNKNMICWSNRKQKAVARSSTKAEYKSITVRTADVIWIWHLLQDIRERIKSSMITCNDQSAIKIFFNYI